MTDGDMTEEEVYQRFLQAVEKAGGQRKFAKQLGLTPSYINDVVNKRRLISDRLLEHLGIERIVTTTYREKPVGSVVGSDRPTTSKSDQF